MHIVFFIVGELGKNIQNNEQKCTISPQMLPENKDACILYAKIYIFQ